MSLVPSATETLLAWGIEPVACTRFCEQPSITAVGGTKDPDLAAIVALKPDLVVMDEEENRREDHAQLVAGGIEVHTLAVRSLDDVDWQLAVLADRVGARWRGLAPIVSVTPKRPAFVPIWRRPWMALGVPTYGSSLLDAIGFTNVFGASAYPTVTLEDAAATNPDLVIVPDEPYPFSERHRPELERVAPAVFVDGKDLFWWGARTGGAIARLTVALRKGTAPAGG